jgi:hypothetical protein
MYPGVIEIKNTEVFRGLLDYPVDSKLSKVILWIVENFGLVITETYRNKRHPNDLHGEIPIRAFDIRAWCYNGGFERARSIERQINEEWVYDAGRPDMKVARLHDSGQGVHFHIQVHPLTGRR